MENRKYRYDAFISYRHLPADKAAAERLQWHLERHKNKDGKHLRIFRDQSELPTSSDLGSDIRGALENSRFLILICSPSYRESKWCMEELRYFRQLHGDRNVNILPLLLEGEPDDVFPQEIRWDTRSVMDENGIARTMTVEIEPLGADIRAATIPKQLRKLRTEYMRIAAPILGVPFDALYQRSKRRQMLTATIAASVVALGATLFAFYNMHMLGQIDAEHQAMLARESLRLATESQDALKEGDTNLAMLLAMEALPEDMENPERPLVEEAEIALRSAVYTRIAAERSSPLQLTASIEFNTPSWAFMGIFNDGRKFAVTDQENIYFYDAATGALLSSCPGDSNDSRILNDGALVAIAETEPLGYTDFKAALYDAITGKLLYESTCPTSISVLQSDQSDVLYFISVSWDENNQRVETLLAAVNPDGTLAPEQVLPARDLLHEPVPDYYNSDSPLYDSAYDCTSWQGAKTELGEKYQALIQQAWLEESWSANVSADKKLIIYKSSEGNTSVIHSLELLEQDIDAPVALEGTISIDTVNQRLYVSSSASLQVYSYDSERFHPSAPANMISRDCSRCAIGSAIYSSDDLSTPLLKVNCKEKSSAGYHITMDLEHIFVHSPEDTFQLWSVSEGLIMELSSNADNDRQASHISVNEDGSLVAIAHTDGSVEVYNRAAEFVRSFQFPEKIIHIEFDETSLLISGYWLSWIADAQGQKATIEISDGTQPASFAQALTSDGLYLCSGEYFDGALDAIYDIQTGECIFKERGYYQYDEELGILLYLPADPRFAGNPVLHAAKRDENGVFQDIYTVTPQEFDMVLPRIPHSAGEQYFMLLNKSCCQVYEITTGKLVFTMYWGSDREIYEQQYCLSIVNNTLYDLRACGSVQPVAYPIMETSQLLSFAESYLTSEFGMRELSALEKSRYFIE